MQSCILGNPNSCLSVEEGFLKPHTLYGRKKSSLRSCGGVLGNWGSRRSPHQAVLLPRCVCCDLLRPSSSSRPKGTSVDTTWASVDTLSQNSPEGVLGRSPHQQEEENNKVADVAATGVEAIATTTTTATTTASSTYGKSSSSSSNSSNSKEQERS
ncbi:hypothetical protein Taro_051669 [Colocasia esculenta]|uniref:Uncharacterized protein n=1 Tax=Colocasia esculenta TaxID=4460 RepID=A0A843XGK5_COLES|nr:hypothetical protein [Colocasia esculenta]